MDESQVQGKNNYISIINPQWNVKFYVIFSMFCNSCFLMLPNTLNFVYVIPYYYCCCLFWYVYVYAFLFQINKRHEISPVFKDCHVLWHIFHLYHTINISFWCPLSALHNTKLVMRFIIVYYKYASLYKVFV